MRPHVIENYGITETVELCEASENYDSELDYDAFIEDIMNDAGIQVEGESREDPEYRGAFDATGDVIYDLCEDFDS